MLERDLITGEWGEIKELLNLPDFPIHMMEEPETSASYDKKLNMRFGIHSQSGLIRVLDLPMREDLYVDAHANLSGSTWKRHHVEVARFIGDIHPNGVLEIGGSTGYLEKVSRDIGAYQGDWTIIEPNPAPAEGTKAKFIKGFYPDDMPNELAYDLIVHTHVWEHMSAPREFIRKISEKMQSGDKMVFSVPNLALWLQNKNTSVLNFEHAVFLTDIYVDYLLERFGFSILKKEAFDNHSVIYCVVKSSQRSGKEPPNFNRIYHDNLRSFQAWADFHRNKTQEYNHRLKKYEGGGYFCLVPISRRSIYKRSVWKWTRLQPFWITTRKSGKNVWAE